MAQRLPYNYGYQGGLVQGGLVLGNIGQGLVFLISTYMFAVHVCLLFYNWQFIFVCIPLVSILANLLCKPCSETLSLIVLHIYLFGLDIGPRLLELAETLSPICLSRDLVSNILKKRDFVSLLSSIETWSR